MVDVESLQSVRILRRADGLSWETVLEPILRDTKDYKAAHLVSLARTDRLISVLLDELIRHPLPEFVMYATPTHHPEVTPVSFASALVSSRAERLVQAAELTAGALDALEKGALQLSAVATRSLFELAVLCEDIHQKLLEPWRFVHGSINRVRKAAASNDFAVDGN